MRRYEAVALKCCSSYLAYEPLFANSTSRPHWLLLADRRPGAGT